MDSYSLFQKLNECRKKKLSRSDQTLYTLRARNYKFTAKLIRILQSDIASDIIQGSRTFSQMKQGFRFSIDRGGTFTDIYAECPNGKARVLKLLSEDPQNYPDAPREGIRRILQEVSYVISMFSVPCDAVDVCCLLDNDLLNYRPF